MGTQLSKRENTKITKSPVSLPLEAPALRPQRVDKQAQTEGTGPGTGTSQRGWIVFWDFENMALWKRYRSLSDILRNVRLSLSKISGPNAVDPHVTRLYGIGNLARLPPNLLKRLQENGITTVDSPARQKNAADLVLVTEIMRSLIETPPQGVCLISNDGDFAHCIKTVTQLGYTTALLHDQPSKELCQTVSKSINSIDLSATYAHKTIPTSRVKAQQHEEEKEKETEKLRPGRTRSLKDNKEATSDKGEVLRSRSIEKPARATYVAQYEQRSILPVYGGPIQNTSFRPGLTHVVRTLELAGGYMEYNELQRRLGYLPYGWLESLLESGQALQRLVLQGNWVVLPRYPYHPRPPLVDLSMP